MIWSPYGSHRTAQPHIVASMFSGFIKLGSMVHYHMLERVLQQYGFMQPIPRSPNALPMVNFSIIDDRWRHYDQYVIVHVMLASAPFSCVDGYLQ